MTLLTVVYETLKSTTDIGVVNPLVFQSIYLLTYPILQWTVGAHLIGMHSTPVPGKQEAGQGFSPSSTPTPVSPGLQRSSPPTNPALTKRHRGFLSESVACNLERTLNASIPGFETARSGIVSASQVMTVFVFTLVA